MLLRTFTAASSTTGIVCSTRFTGTGNVVLATSPSLVSPTVSSGGLTVTAGGLTVSAGGANITGTVTGTASNWSGNVGIGTTTPFATLDIAGTLNLSNQTTGSAVIELGQNRTGNGYAYIDFHGDTTYSDYGLRVMRENSGANAQSSIYHCGTGSLYIDAQEAAPIIFATTNTERVRIDSSGNVGIGNTSPQALLHVSGTSTTTLSAAALENVSTANVLTKATALNFYGHDTVNTQKQVASITALGDVDSNWVGSDLVFSTRLSDAVAEKMRITNAGNVGIGSTAPATALDVNGTVTATAYSGSGASLTSLNGSNVSSGTVPTANLGSGTANSTTFLRGDQTWATPTGGSVGTLVFSNATCTSSGTTPCTATCPTGYSVTGGGLTGACCVGSSSVSGNGWSCAGSATGNRTCTAICAKVQ